MKCFEKRSITQKDFKKRLMKLPLIFTYLHTYIIIVYVGLGLQASSYISVATTVLPCELTMNSVGTLSTMNTYTITNTGYNRPYNRYQYTYDILLD
jgi:predicted ferric reductase